MKAGETKRFDCPDCYAEYDVTYEPKAKGAKVAKDIKPAVVTVCPFCATEIAPGEDDDDKDDDDGG